MIMTTMNNDDMAALEKAIFNALPAELREKSALIAKIIVDLADSRSGSVTQSEAIIIEQIMNALSGQTITTTESFVSFGKGGSIQEISVGGIAGGNIININIDGDGIVKRKVVTKRRATMKNSPEQKHLGQLINIKSKRLQLLEQQAAHFGSLCPPHITMEIEELMKEIAKLQKRSKA
jgi:hypothetical protein